MSPRKYVPLLVGALLITALMLIFFSRSMNWNQTDNSNGITLVEPAGGQQISEVVKHIYVNVSLPSVEYRRVLHQNNEFMTKYPQIRVHMTNDNKIGNNYTALSKQSANGNAPDVMLLNNSQVIPLAVQGYLNPVDSLMSGDVYSDQLAGLLEPIKWNGYLWGTPNDINPYIIAWNKNMLTEAGLTSAPKDWTMLQQVVGKLGISDAQRNRHLINFSPGDMTQLLLMVTKFNVDRSNLINLVELKPKQASQLSWLQSMPGAVVTIPLDKKNELSELIVNNQLLMLIMPWEKLSLLSESAQENVLVDQDALYYPWLNGSSYVISSSSKFEDEAMLWIQEMTNTSHSLEQFEASNQLPVRTSVYDREGKMLAYGARMPPSWWGQSMNAKLPQEELFIADPKWLSRWSTWEEAWERATGDIPRLDTFIEEMTSR
ncbi:hypothetical protein L3i20_v227420 [Paenibacillus sp. L3-i20]|nr:hypothetical protein L3i20_v227420 [Paenibacillus sp. L3-i20]